MADLVDLLDDARLEGEVAAAGERGGNERERDRDRNGKEPSEHHDSGSADSTPEIINLTSDIRTGAGPSRRRVRACSFAGKGTKSTESPSSANVGIESATS